MNRKPAAIFSVFVLAAALFAVGAVVFAGGVKAESADVELVSTSDAYIAAERMERLCCGSVLNADISMEKSAFCTDFVPREPEYVVRFRHYDGPKADFVPVLMYHFFYDAETEKPTNGINSHAIQSVRAQLQWLWENGYVTLSMDELYEWLEGNIEIPAKCVVITSDDGQENFFKLFQPELHRYGYIGTSFVITGWRKNLEYKLTLPNIELHSHSHDMHKGEVAKGGKPDNRGMMQGVSVKYGVADLTKSSQLLNGSKYFAYPYGTYGGKSKEILRKAGFRLAFTTESGFVRRGDDPLQLCRCRVMGSVFEKGFSYLIEYEKVAEKYE